MTLGPTKSISWISLHNPSELGIYLKNSHGFPRLSKRIDPLFRTVTKFSGL